MDLFKIVKSVFVLTLLIFSGIFTIGIKQCNDTKDTPTLTGPIGFSAPELPMPSKSIGVLHVALGERPNPTEKSREGQILDIVEELRPIIPSPRTIVFVSQEDSPDEKFTCDGIDRTRSECFFHHFLGTTSATNKAILVGDSAPYVHVSWDTNQITLEPDVASPIFSFVPRTFPSDHEATVRLGSLRSEDSGGFLLNDRFEESQFAGSNELVPFEGKRSGDYWSYWKIMPLAWEFFKQFVPPADSARSVSGALLYKSISGQLHLIWAAEARGNDFRIAIMENPPLDWTTAGARRIVTGATGNPIGSNFAPAVTYCQPGGAGTPTKYYLAWTTRGAGNLRVISASDSLFSADKNIENLGLTGAGPALTCTKNALLITYRGAGGDNSLYLQRSTDGVNWTAPSQIVTDFVADSSPGMASIGDRVLIVHKTDGRVPRFRTILSEDGGITWRITGEMPGSRACWENRSCAPFVLPLRRQDRCLEKLSSDPGDRFYVFMGSFLHALPTNAEASSNNKRLVGFPFILRENPPNGRGFFNPVFSSAIYKECRFYVVGQFGAGISEHLATLVSYENDEVATNVHIENAQ